MNKIGIYKFVAEPFHCDFSEKIYLGVLGNQMLNAADFHSTDRGFGMKYLMGIHRSWVLSRLAIELVERPKQYEHYTIETWVENALRFFTKRNFRITGDDGKVFGYGRSVWAMIDTETRQPCDIYAINDGAIKDWIEAEKPCPIDNGDRVKMSNEAELVRSIDTYYHDIDINGHVNSVKYIEHVIDLWDLDWYKEHEIKRFDIAYVAETHQGDKLNFYREQTGPMTYSIRLVKTVKDTGEEVEVCRCKVSFF
ncbi:MAG: acyl-[acyl-carrier-protein] thioesterase [Bacteroidales bacterium]|nr:acyl-[acyl-carrier-protein] thioesterase [Bacteroidales bacterium]